MKKLLHLLVLLSLAGLAALGTVACSSEEEDETEVQETEPGNLTENSYLELSWTPTTTNPNLSFYMPRNLNVGNECELGPAGGFSEVYNQSLVTGLSGTRYELFSRTSSGNEQIDISPDLPDGTYYLYYNFEGPLAGTNPPPFNWTVRYFQGPDTLLETFTGSQSQVFNTLCDPFYNMGIAVTKSGNNVSFSLFAAPPAPPQPDTLAFTESASFSFTLTDSSRIALDEPTPDDNYDMSLLMTRELDQDLCNCNAVCVATFALNSVGVNVPGVGFLNFTPQRVAGRPSREFIRFPAALPDGNYYIYFLGSSTFAKPFVLEGMTNQTTVSGRLSGAWNFPGRCGNENIVGYRTRIRITKSGTTATVSRF